MNEHATTIEEEAVDPEIKVLEEQLEAEGEIFIEDEPEPESEAEELIVEEEEQPKVEAVQTDDDDDEIPPELSEGEHPQRDHFAKTREAAKRFKDRAIKAEARIAELEKGGTAPPAAEPEGSTEQPQAKNDVTPEQVAEMFMKGKFGRYEDDATNEKVHATAKTIIDQMTPTELLSIRDAAAEGKFGEFSQDALDLVSEQLPVSLARDKRGEQARDEQTQNQQKWEADFTKANTAMVEQYPDLAKDDSPFTLFIQDWISENVVVTDAAGKIIEHKPLAVHLQSPNWPEILVPMAANAFIAAGKGGRLSKATHSTTTRKVGGNLTTSPAGRAGGSNADPQNGGDSDDLQKLENQLRELGDIPWS